ncbi:MAG: ribonuclease T [Rubrimonas sp.]
MACRFAAAALSLALWSGASFADAPGDFDYYVLSLSWNASWCAAEGDARDAPQCDPREEFGFVLHGLWPQHERGWPEWCRSAHPDPARRETAAMADVMGSGGLAWHQWKKHGRCSGLSPRAYFALSRRAFDSVARPPALRALTRPVEIAPEVIEAAFLEANPGMTPDGVTVTCAEGLFREVRICLTRDLAPRPCAPDAARDCPARMIDLPPMR